MDLTAAEVVRLDIMKDLNQAPRKCRKKYGKRQKLTEEEKADQSRERNREHARSTRKRKKLFFAVLETKLLEMERDITLCFATEESFQRHLLERRKDTVKLFFSQIMVSDDAELFKCILVIVPITFP
jgi:hypothetical protein